MSFTFTELYREKTVNGAIVHGKYVNTSGSTGGTIYPSLSQITGAQIQPVTTAVVTSFPVVNGTLANFPISGGTGIIIVTVADTSGFITIYGI